MIQEIQKWGNQAQAYAEGGVRGSGPLPLLGINFEIFIFVSPPPQEISCPSSDKTY